ncbi:MAG: hypothetical protein U0929_01735 [Planctomycetaceae bacterium]
MQTTSPTLAIHTEDTTRTLVLSIHAASYRSSDDAQLLTLRRELEALAGRMESARHVIIDLTQVAIFGSSFLRLMFDTLAPLKLLGIRTMLCGDHNGLVVLTAIEHWITVTNTLDEALELTTGFVPRHDQFRNAHGNRPVECVA